MNKIYSTILLLSLIGSLQAQTLKTVYQSGYQAQITASTCNINPDCDDSDPSTLDQCLPLGCVNTTFNGIPNSQVHKMEMDANGVLWYSTRGGLVRYDGTNVQYLSNRNSNWTGLEDPVGHTEIYLDQANTPWMLGWGAIGSPGNNAHQIGHWDGDNWEAFHSQNSGMANAWVRDYAVNANGEVWVLHVSPHMLSHFDGTNWTVIQMNQVPFFSNYNEERIEIDAAGNPWIMAGNTNIANTTSLLHWDGTTWQAFNIGSLVAAGVAPQMMMDSGGGVWIYNVSNTIARYLNGNWTTYNLPTIFYASELAEGQNGKIWIAGGNGLAELDPTTGNYTLTTAQNSNMPFQRVRSVAANPASPLVYVSAGYQIDAGTPNAGLARFDGNAWTYLPPVAGPDKEFARAQITYGKDGNMWYRGLYSHQKAYFDGIDWKDIPGLNHAVIGLTTSANGETWMLTDSISQNWSISWGNQRLRHFDGNTLTTLNNLPFSLGGFWAESDNDHLMLIDQSSLFWICVGDELWTYDGSTWAQIINVPLNGQFEYLISIVEDGNGTIWLYTSEDKLFRYDGQNWIQEISNLPSYGVKLLVDAVDNIWIVADNSLIRYDGVNTTFYGSGNSPVSNLLLRKLFADPLGDVWVPDYNGELVKFDGQTYPVYDLNSLGVPVDTFTHFAFHPNGELWVGDKHGVVVIGEVLDSEMVWPGDADNDGIANNFDLLALGIAFNSTGPVRNNASLNWQGQLVSSWANTLPNSENYAHTDTDGSGLVNDDDTLAITLNYGLTHNKVSSNSQLNGTPLLLLPDLNSYSAGDTVEAPIFLGADTLMADSVYGIAFTLNYDPTLIDSASLEISFANSWLGNKGSDMITFNRDEFANGQLHVALSRTDQIEKTGFGELAKIRVIMIDDVSGKDLLRDTLLFSFSDVKMIRLDGTEIPYFTEATEIEITQEVATDVEVGLAERWTVYPNPARQTLFIESQRSLTGTTKLQLLTLEGKVVYQSELRRQQHQISLQGLSQGMYILVLQTDQQRYQQKLMIIK